MKKSVVYILIAMLLIVISVFAIYLNNPTQKAEAYIKGWENMGMYLPKDQIPFFAKHFSVVKDNLVQAMTHSKSDIRQRAAYVIEGIGHQAQPLETDILKSLQKESDRTVRLYFYSALRSIGANSEQSLTYLRDQFELLSQQDDPSDGRFYKSSDEKIKVAAVLFVLDDDIRRRQEYLDVVLKWLEPPSLSQSPLELEAYWEHRWVAVNVVEFMTGAKEAIPLLEAMLSEDSTKAWVSVHVPRALKALRRDSVID